jgi:CopG family nickel-responsive transcriptional regulator
VSISLNEKMLEDIDSIQKSLGFSGRSELIRSAVRRFITEERELNKITGRIDSILLATHAPNDEKTVIRTKHSFDDIIATHIHSKLENGKCLETFLLAGEADRVRAMFQALQVSRKVDYVRLLLT